MAGDLDDEIFNKASNQAMQEALTKTAEERLKIMEVSDFSLIIAELKKKSVDKILVEKLENEINAATNKNQVIVDVIKKGGTIANELVKILK